MNIPFVDLGAQYHSLKEEMDTAIFDVLENTAFIGGSHVDAFQENYQNAYGVDHCVPCGNGTDALYIVMRMMGIGEGDEVITTASSWISTSETISQAGARPVFVDIDEYYTIDATKIEDRITDRTKAIIPVHLYGQMCNMPGIMAIAQKHDLHVIEDCAQSHFALLNGRRAGLWGDAATFSFYPGKNLGAYGDAGCIITNNEELAMDCRRYANHGALVKHHHEIEGINSRMDGLQAAVLNVKLPYIHEWTRKRQEVAHAYREGLQELEEIQLPGTRPDSEHVFHVFGIRTDNRDALMKYLKYKGIASQVHYPKAMPYMPAYDWVKAKKEDYPNAWELQEKELSLPIYPEMTVNQIINVVDCVKSFFHG